MLQHQRVGVKIHVHLSVSENTLLHCFTLICSKIVIHAAAANRGSVASTSQGARGALAMGLNNACTLPQEVYVWISCTSTCACSSYLSMRKTNAVENASRTCHAMHRLHAMQCTHCCASFTCHAMHTCLSIFYMPCNACMFAHRLHAMQCRATLHTSLITPML